MNILNPVSKFLIAIVIVLIFMASATISLAEQKYGTYWLGESYRSGNNYIAQSYITGGGVRYFMLAHARGWGSSPNPLKEEDLRSCYNCGATSQADVYALYTAIYVAKHQMQFYSYSGVETLYTSQTGYQSTATCWNSGVC